MNSQNQTFQSVINRFCFLLCFFCIPFPAISQDSALLQKLNFFLYSPTGETIEGAVSGSFWFVSVKDSERNNLPAHLEIPGRYNGPDKDGDVFNLPVYVAYDFMGSNISSVSFSPEIKKIGDNCFLGCKKISSIVIPNSISEVGQYAFKECTSLSSVVVSPQNRVTSSFSGCDIKKGAYPIGKRSLVAEIEVAYPTECIPTSDGLIFSPDNTCLYFAPWMITKLELPSTVSIIGSKALAGCTKLDSLIVKSPIPPAVSEDTFNGTIIKKLIVPIGASEAYKQDNDWKQFASIIIEKEFIEEPENPDEENPTKIVLDQTQVILHPNETVYLKATVINPKSQTANLEWTSSNAEIASVDSHGMVTAIGLGTTVITVTDGTVSAKCEISVVGYEVTHIELEPDNTTLEVGETISLVAKVYPKEAPYPLLTWSSTNSAVIEIDEISGYMTALTVGTSEIKATYQKDDDTQIFGSSMITVVPKTEITLDYNSIEIKTGESFQLHATIFPEGENDKTITWMSGNEDIAIVDSNGLVRATGVGTTYVSAWCGSSFDKCQVTTYLHDLEQGDEFEYTYKDNTITYMVLDSEAHTVTVKKGTIVTPQLYIPSTAEYRGITYHVERIAADAFREIDESNYWWVSLPNSITHIGARAFMGCTKLLMIDFPTSLEHVEEDAFKDSDIMRIYIPSLEWLCNMDFPNKEANPLYGGFGATKRVNVIVKNVGSYSDLPNDVKIDGNIKKIGSYALAGICAHSIEIGPSVEVIGEGAFYCSRYLTTVIINAPLSEIPKDMFRLCQSLKSIKLNNKIKSISDYAFCSTGLQTLDVPAAVESIGEGAFYHCFKLESITFNGALRTIGDYAFSYCSLLKEIILPPLVEFIGKNAFNTYDVIKDAYTINPPKCSISRIVLGPNIKNIGEGAFYNNEDGCQVFITAQTPPSLNPEILRLPACLYLQGQDALNKYKDTIYWSDYFSSMGLISTEIKSLEIDRSIITGNAGDTVQLTAKIEPANVTLPYVFWKSTNPEIAIVDNHGLVTLVKDDLDDNRDSNGINECKIICETLYANAPIAVADIGESDIPQPQSIEWVQDFNDITVGDSFELSATATSGLPVEYTSSATNIATIENGIVTFLSPGNVTLTARQAGNEKYLPAQSVDISVDIKPVSVKELYLDHSERNCKVGDSFILTATVLPENATDKSLSWTSSDLDVATVDENGNITAVTVGECIVTATAADGSDISAQCKVIVNPILVESINLDHSERNCKVGDSFILTATVQPENATDKSLSWASSDLDVATVDENGNITAVTVGECIVTATAADGSNVSACCNVTVSPRLVESIELDCFEWNGMPGESFVITATVRPDNATDKTVVWDSSDQEVAIVDEAGLVTAVNTGIAIITATTSNDLTATCKVTVLPVLVESIILNPSEIQGEIGESFTIEATILPENASEPKIEWESTNPTVATVSQVGHVEILKEGTCRIIAYATDSSDVSAECIIIGNSGIESIFTDRTDHISVYTPEGLLVKKDCSSDDLKNIVPGIYMITTETKTIKVILR